MNTIIPHHYFEGKFGHTEADEARDQAIFSHRLWAVYVDFRHCFEDGFEGHPLLIGATVVNDDFLHLYVKIATPYVNDAYRSATRLEEAVIEWAADEGLAVTRYGVRYDLCFPQPL